MSRGGLLTAALLVSCALLILGGPPTHAAGLSCTITTTSTGAYSVSFSGTVSGGMPTYKWTLVFGDGSSTVGTIGSSGGSYSASHTYPSKGTYSVDFTATDSKISSAPDSCNLPTMVTVKGPIQVNATLADGVAVSDAATSSAAQKLTDQVTVGDNALSVPAILLNENIGLLESATRWVGNLFTEIVNLLDTGQGSTTSATRTTTGVTTPGGGGFPVPLLFLAIPVVGVILLVSLLTVLRFRTPRVRR